MAAVKQDWLAMEHASDSLKSDEEIVLVAVKQDWRARMDIVSLDRLVFSPIHRMHILHAYYF